MKYRVLFLCDRGMLTPRDLIVTSNITASVIIAWEQDFNTISNNTMNYKVVAWSLISEE